jgi:hypothetical protein
VLPSSTPLTQAVLAWFHARHAAAADPRVFPFDSEWVRARPGEAFLRYGPRVCAGSGTLQTALVLANLELHPRSRSKGIFGEDLLPVLIALAHTWGEPLLLENVINPRLAAFLQRQGHPFTGDPRLPTFHIGAPRA